MQDISCVINRRGKLIRAFAEVLLDLGLFEYQRINRSQEINIARLNFVYLCAETSLEKMLSAEQSS